MIKFEQLKSESGAIFIIDYIIITFQSIPLNFTYQGVNSSINNCTIIIQWSMLRRRHRYYAVQHYYYRSDEPVNNSTRIFLMRKQSV